MKDETQGWLSYAEENLAVARLALEHGHLNACLQNAQQAVEKALKAIIIEHGLESRRTHSIRQLIHILDDGGFSIDISEEACDLLDTIYVPSKYPVYSVLPDIEVNRSICIQALNIAEKVQQSAEKIVK